MKKSSGSDMSKSNSLRPEDFEKGIQNWASPSRSSTSAASLN